MRENPGSQTFKFLDMHAYYPWFRSAFPPWRVQVEERTLANNIRDVNPVCLPEIRAHHGDMILKSLRICWSRSNHNFSQETKVALTWSWGSITFCFLPDAQHLWWRHMRSCKCRSILGSAHAYYREKEKKNLKSNVTYMYCKLAQSNTTVYQIWSASLG